MLNYCAHAYGGSEENKAKAERKILVFENNQIGFDDLVRSGI